MEMKRLMNSLYIFSFLDLFAFVSVENVKVYSTKKKNIYFLEKNKILGTLTSNALCIVANFCCWNCLLHYLTAFNITINTQVLRNVSQLVLSWKNCNSATFLKLSLIFQNLTIRTCVAIWSRILKYIVFIVKS